MDRRKLVEPEVTFKDYTDRNGNRVREEYDGGELRERTQYNSKGEMIEVLIPGDIRTCYKYDENGDEMEMNQYFINEDGVEEHAYQGFKKYDKEGRVIDYEYENIADGHSHFTYKYQEFEGKVLKKAYDDDGELVDVELVIS